MGVREGSIIITDSAGSGLDSLPSTPDSSRATSPIPDATRPVARISHGAFQSSDGIDTQGVNQGTTTPVPAASISSPDVASAPALGGGTDVPKTPTEDTRASGWANLIGLFRVLDRSVDEFGPLKPVVGELVACVSVYHRVAGSRSDFRQLQIELEAIFWELIGWYSGSVPPVPSPSLLGLCSSILDELLHVKKEQNRATTWNSPRGREAVDQVLAGYRRIQGHLQRLTLNANTLMWEISDELAASAYLTSLSPSVSSVYNSNQATELKRGECTPGTRVDVLAGIRDWIHNGDTGPIYWMDGMAGTGKTTIAYSLCAELESSYNLGASFFCSRMLPECRDVNRIIPSIAYQLAQFSHPFRCALLRILETDPDAYTQLLRTQFEKLVAQPLKEVRDTLPSDLVVVIDALDECVGGSLQSLIETILTITPGLPIKFFLGSRPDPEIREVMETQAGASGVSKLVLHELDKRMVQHDIEIYLREALGLINPPESEISLLAETAGALFIYAAAVVRHIDVNNPSQNPGRKFKEALSAGRSNRYKELDQLYTVVLTAVFESGSESDSRGNPKDLDDTEQVLHTVLCVCEPLTTRALSGLLGWHSLDRVHTALAPLRSVVYILGSNALVTTPHSSFTDYMFDPSRSVQFHCNPAKHNWTLAKHCFDCLGATKPQFNICGLESSCVPDKAIPDLDARIQTMIPPEALYACQHWEQHLQCAVQSVDLLDRLDRFFSSRLLLWMEILNFNGCITTGVEILQRVKEWCLRQSCGEDIKRLVHDAWRFVAMFTSNPVSQSACHIYMSMLPCWPAYSPIAKHYAHLTQKVIQGTAIAGRSLVLLASWPIGSGVGSLTWSPDGTCVAFISGGHIYVYDSLSGHPVLGPLSPRALLPGSRNATAYGFTSIGFSPDGARIVSGSADGAIYLWDSKEGKRLLEPQKGHTRRISSVVFSSDNKSIASGSEDGSLKVWDAQDGKKRLDPIQGHSGSVMSVVFFPDCTRIVSGSDDRTLRIWDLQTGKLALGPLQGHTGSVSLVVCSSDGTRIASSSYDRTVRVWDAQTGAPIAAPFEGHTGPVNSVAFSPDGTRIISGSEDRTIRMWDAQSGELIGNPLEGHTGAVSSVAFSPDGARFASTSNDESIKMWDAQAEQPKLSELRAHTGYVSSVAFSPSGARIASSSQDKTIRMWDGQSGELIPGPLQEHVNLATSVAFSPEGTRVVSGCHNNTVRVWDVQTGQPKLNPLKAHAKPVSSVAFSPDGTCIISGSYDKTIRMWDAQSGRALVGALRGHTDLVLSVAFSPEGARIASGSDDKTIRIWHAATGQPIIGPLEGHTDAVTSVAFSPDGTRIASGSFDETIRMWDAQTGQSLGSFIGHGGSVFSVAFSPDGNSLVSGSYDKTVRLWDTQTGQPLLGPFEGHTNGVSSVSFSPDGTRIVSGSYDRTIRAWDARTEVHMPSGSPLTSPFSWELTDDGWVVESGNSSNLLVWIPPDLRRLLLSPRAIFVTSEAGYIRPDFESAHIGASWTECYKPHVH